MGVSDLIYLIAEACSAIPGFQPALTGGDGDSVPFCEYPDICTLSVDLILTPDFLVFVGYWPQQNSVIISHEGTDPTQLCVSQ